MNTLDILLLILIAAAVFLAVRSIRSARRRGKGCMNCGGSCAACGRDCAQRREAKEP